MNLDKFKKVITNINAILQERTGFEFGYLDDNILIKEMLKKIYKIHITTKESYLLQYHDFKFTDHKEKAKDLTKKDIASKKFLDGLYTVVKYTKKQQKDIDDGKIEMMKVFMQDLHDKLQEVITDNIKSNSEFYLLKHGYMVDNETIELLEKMQVNIKVLYLKSFWEEIKSGHWKTGYKESNAKECNYTVLYIHRGIEGKYNKPETDDVIKTYDSSSDEEMKEVEVSKKKVDDPSDKIKELKEKPEPGRRKVVRKTIKRVVKKTR